MWRYIALNGLWFAILFLVHFFGTSKSRVFVLFALLAGSAWMVVYPGVDPFAWAGYTVFSLLVYWGAFQFRRWSTASIITLDEEVRMISKRFQTVRERLGQVSAETEAIRSRADEITYLCGKIKEMSQSLDRLETFLVFGEALAKHFPFEAVKLCFVHDGARRSKKEGESYELYFADFQGLFDRGRFLKERSRVQATLTDFDRSTAESVGQTGRPLCALLPGRQPDESASAARPGSWYMAHPIFLQKQVFAVVLILGIHQKDIPIFSILTESFAADMQRVRLYERVETLATTDGLTGVSVRRHLMERLETEVHRSKRLGLKLSFLMIDIDNFKRINDDCGHLVGDVILKEVAETIKKNIREIDLVGRYGGEEFGVYLIETDESGAFYVAERIRRAVDEKPFRAYGEELHITVSIGSSTFSHELQDAAQIVDAADLALYKAKRQGKNRVHMASLGV